MKLALTSTLTGSGQLDGQRDFLTTYQAEFSREQQALAAKRKATQLGLSGNIAGSETKSAGIHCFHETKHDKNKSFLECLSQPCQNDGCCPSTDEVPFGTYHWKRCDVTKTHHPGLCYR